MKKILLMVLLVAFSAFLLVSCGENEQEQQQEDIKWAEIIKVTDTEYTVDGAKHSVKISGVPAGYSIIPDGTVSYTTVGEHEVKYLIKDASGNVVYTVKATLSIKDAAPADPSGDDPADPSDPSDPSDPADPSDPSDPSEPVDPSDDTKIYFTQKWDAVYVYAWNDEGDNKNAEWPGVDISANVARENDGYGHKILYYDLGETMYDNFVFNDGINEGDGVHQTEDTAVELGMQYYVAYDEQAQADMTTQNGNNTTVYVLASTQYVPGEPDPVDPEPDPEQQQQGTGFGYRINTNDPVQMEHLSDKDHQGRDQYKAAGVVLAENDEIDVYDFATGVYFANFALDPYGAYESFEMGESKITVKVAGTYNLFFKFQMNDNVFYVELAQ